MYESVLQNALQLPWELKEELVAAPGAAIFEEMSAVPEGEPARCPRCGHAHVVSKGHDRDGGRRWLCRGCGRTFSAKTSGVLALPELGPDAWSAYVEGVVGGESLRRLAERCGVCLKTAWYMRMRVCSVMDANRPVGQDLVAHVLPQRTLLVLETPSRQCGQRLEGLGLKVPAKVDVAAYRRDVLGLNT